MSDFSLMDAIECGIVKLPRVPVADNIPGEEMPKFRNLWEHIRKRMPKKGRGKAKTLDPLSLPVELQTALEALYGHYERPLICGRKPKFKFRPASSSSAITLPLRNLFMTSSRVFTEKMRTVQRLSKMVGWRSSGISTSMEIRCPAAYAAHRQRTTRIRRCPGRQVPEMATDEIERFRREIIERTGDRQQAENITDQDLLREVMNTVGKEDRLGGSIRCVVSVSMLTEGWDANTSRMCSGVRAFGTQLFCEQVIGRALRRQSYDLNEEATFQCRVCGRARNSLRLHGETVIAPPQPPRETIQVKAVRPDRDALKSLSAGRGLPG